MLNGVKYFTLQADEGKCYGKKGVRHIDRVDTAPSSYVLQADGVVIVKCKQCVVIGIYEGTAGAQAQQAATVVEALGDWLKNNGY